MRSDPPATRESVRSKPDTQAILPLASSLRLVVSRLARRLRQQAEPGVTASQLSVLATIDRHGSMTLSDLAQHERVTPPSITASMGRLGAAGLVTREIDPDDKRVSRISLSRDGRRFLESVRSRKNAYLTKRLARLSAEDRGTLERAAAILERLLEEEDR
jgi:DNA-binding MarR family transcriptional regulator